MLHLLFLLSKVTTLIVVKRAILALFYIKIEENLKTMSQNIFITFELEMFSFDYFLYFQKQALQIGLINTQFICFFGTFKTIQGSDKPKREILINIKHNLRPDYY